MTRRAGEVERHLSRGYGPLETTKGPRSADSGTGVDETVTELLPRFLPILLRALI